MKTNSKKIILKNQLNTAVLFLVFNRPDTTNKVFEKIRQVKPLKLYIAGDGCREGNEDDKEKIKKVREIISNIDWYCEVKTLFRDKNLGCKNAVSQAITWFFKNEEQGIVLEDDCLPSESFFYFCEYALEKFKKNPNIFGVGGTNLIGSTDNKNYILSLHGTIWGWATWANRWKHYKVDIEDDITDLISTNYPTCLSEKINFEIILNESKKKNLDTWDYQWLVTRIKNNGLTVMPPANLIKNIGFGHKSATHTKNSNKKIEIENNNIDISFEEIRIKRNLEYDKKLWKYRTPFLSRVKLIFNYILKKIFN